MRKLGVIMDSIFRIHYEKDSTLAMLWEAEKRDWEIHYFEQKDIFLRDGKVHGNSTLLNVFHDPNHWFILGKKRQLLLSELDAVLMRKDPPVNANYIYTTYLLEQAEQEGVLVVNKPKSLRDANEKLFTILFPQCCPETLVTSDVALIKTFLHEHKKIVCKPLNAMGGYSVFQLTENDPNVNVILEMLTYHSTRLIVAQRFIPDITVGDKRILLINGNPVSHALARVPAENDWRGNLAAGAKGVAQPLTKRDQWICEQVGPALREKGLLFVGLDVIGDYLTEINVTSPTCIRELQAQCGLDVAKELIDSIEKILR